jgi:ligand-binding sensor domain-containing protein/signal transduction histidine kinase
MLFVVVCRVSAVLNPAFFRYCMMFLLLLNAGGAAAQRYNFKNYDIEDGLIQSQAQRIYQDREHNLWISTFGGVSRFNGREFTNYDVNDGLDGVVTSIMQDGAGHMWFGGMTLNYFDGKRIRKITKPDGTRQHYFHHLSRNADGTLWGIWGSRLFKIHNFKIQFVDIAPGAEVQALSASPGGELYASVGGQGIFVLRENKWKRFIAFRGNYKELAVRRILFDRYMKDKLYLQSFDEMVEVDRGRMMPFSNPHIKNVKGSFISVNQDDSGALWICTTAGLYSLSDTSFRYFKSQNGFTDNQVNDISVDNAGNMWFATEGSGIFRYNGDMYMKFDQTQGLPNEVIMSLAGNRRSGIWMGTFGGGLIHYKNSKISTLKIPSEEPRAQTIFCLYLDKRDALWIGTLKAGLWKYEQGKFRLMSDGKSGPSLVNGMVADSKGTIWVTSPEACYYYVDNVPAKVTPYDGHTGAIAEIGNDSMLVGYDKGVRLIRNKQFDPSFRIAELEGKNVLSIKKYGGYAFIGTSVDGLFIMNISSGKVKNYKQADGLYSNAIYSITSDNTSIWLGTGRGINKISFDKRTMGVKMLNDHSPVRLVVEANQNSSLFDGKDVWIGTAKGVFVYNPLKTVRFTQPHVRIQSVRISQPREDTLLRGGSGQRYLDIAKSHKLAFRQNNLIISYGGVYLSDQEALRYQYRLVGLEDNFSAPVRSTTVNYLSIPEGNYTFEVKAVLENGLSSEIESFSFVIVPPFYRTITFRIILLFLIVFSIALIQYYLNARKEKRRLLIESITREEKRKIREQTAEDFHDDMGNKLTRISILSDILASKIDPAKTEEISLIGQIKDSASALYNGTKDILWALDPKADNLYEIITHLYYFGTDLFSNTGIRFEFAEPDPDLKKIRLPMEYTRNITMIFKELMNNALKHSQAKNVKLTIHADHEEIVMKLMDDGKGFNCDDNYPGKGMVNTRNRSKRIRSDLQITSDNKGTTSTLTINKAVN